MQNFFHRKALVVLIFVGNSATDHYFLQKIFLRDTSRVILDLITWVSSLYHVGGVKKGGQTHTQTECIYIKGVNLICSNFVFKYYLIFFIEIQ